MIFSYLVRTREEHIAHVRRGLGTTEETETVCQSSVNVNSFDQEVEFLGHRLGMKGLQSPRIRLVL